MKKDKNMEGKNFFRFYYHFIIVYAMIGFIELAVNAHSSFFLWHLIAFLLYASVFILSIIAIIRFKQYKYPKYTFILPIFELSTYVLDLIIGIVSASLAFKQTYFSEAFANFFTWWATIIISILELGISIYILKKMSK